MRDTRERMDLIGLICNRAIAVCQLKLKKLDLFMDIDYADQDVPMNLQQLLDFDEGNFLHDVGGICRHLNRETLKLEDCFTPRCALPEVPVIPLSGL